MMMVSIGQTKIGTKSRESCEWRKSILMRCAVWSLTHANPNMTIVREQSVYLAYII